MLEKITQASVLDRIAKDIDKAYTKSEAIMLMQFKIPMIECSIYSKLSYNGEYLIYHFNKFMRVTEDNAVLIDINSLPTKYYQVAALSKNIIPKEVWKTNLQEGILEKCTFTGRVISQSIDLRPKLIRTGIYAYMDSRRNFVTLKLDWLSPNSDEHKSVKNLEFFSMTNNVFLTKEEAINDIQYFVKNTIHLNKKRLGRHKNNRPLKNMQTVEKFINDYPEILI